MHDSKQVFLVAGHVPEPKVGGRMGIKPTVEQRVIIAAGATLAARQLAALEPEFVTLGMTSLHDFEQAIVKIRAVANGESTEWPLIVVPTT